MVKGDEESEGTLRSVKDRVDGDWDSSWKRFRACSGLVIGGMWKLRVFDDEVG